MGPSIFSSIVFIRVSLPKIWLCFYWFVRVRCIFVLMRKVVGAALGGALWVRSPKTSGVSIRPLAYQFACSLAHLLAPHYSLCSRAPLRSFARSLVHSLAPELMGQKFLSLNWTRRFHSVSSHCAMRTKRKEKALSLFLCFRFEKAFFSGKLRGRKRWNKSLWVVDAVLSSIVYRRRRGPIGRSTID